MLATAELERMLRGASLRVTRPRVVITNIADCGNVLSVYDYTDVANIKTVGTLTAAAAGWTP